CLRWRGRRLEFQTTVSLFRLTPPSIPVIRAVRSSTSPENLSVSTPRSSHDRVVLKASVLRFLPTWCGLSLPPPRLVATRWYDRGSAQSYKTSRPRSRQAWALRVPAAP